MKKLLSFLLFLMLASGGKAQTYEIRAVNKGNGVVAVEIRIVTGTAPTTANRITDLSFGIKWLSSYNVDLLNTITTGYNINKSGTRQAKNNYHYQAFFADATPFILPLTLTLTQWVEVMSVGNTRNGTVPTGTFQITEKDFDITTDPNIGIDLVDYSPTINGSATGVILPVKLTRFEVIPINKIIQVQWATANEQNNKGFEIERSETDGSNFKKIGWMDGRGNSNATQEYSFTNSDVVAKTRYYYRLKQVDINGNYEYSVIKSAMLTGNGGEAIIIKPNPVNKILQITFGDWIEKGEGSLKIIDSKGAAMIKKTAYLQAGKMLEIDISKLLGGQYFIVVESGGALLGSKAFIKN